MPSFRNIEIARAGIFDLAVGGETTFTTEDFADAAAASQDPEISDEFGMVRVRPGHDDPRFDGSPSFGRLANLRVVGDRLLADWVDVPWSVAAGVREEYPERSIEAYGNVTTASGRNYRMVVTGLALLGLTPPAIDGMAPLPEAVAAAQRLRIAAASGVMGLSNVPDASTSATPAETRAIVFASREQSRATGEPMDLTALRQALDLGDDVSDEDVLAAAATAATENATLTGRVAELETSPPPPPAPEGTPTASPGVPDGAVVVDGGQWEEIQQEIAASRADREARARSSEEEFVVRARRQGRLGPATNPNSARLEAALRREYQRNPGEAEAFMASLAQVVPTTEVGHAEGADMTTDDAVYAALFGGES